MNVRTFFVLGWVFCAAAAQAHEWERDVDALIARRFPKLARRVVSHTMMHALYYRADLAEVVGKTRRDFPRDHPLYVDPADALSADDVVLLSMRLDAASDARHSIAFTEGPSADPEFYLIDPSGEELPLHFGATVLVAPGDGTLLTFGRHNALFLQKRMFRMKDGKPAEVRQPFLAVGLRSSVSAHLTMRSQSNAGEVIAELAPGDVVDIVGADVSEPDRAFLVRNELGLVGWIRLNASLAQPELTALSWLGD